MLLYELRLQLPAQRAPKIIQPGSEPVAEVNSL